MSYGSRNGVMTKGVVSGGFDLHLWHITSSASQTLRRRLVRTTATGAAMSPSRLYFSHFASCRVYNTVDLYAVSAAAIFVQNRVFCLPHLQSTPQLGGPGRNIAIPFGMEKLEWLGYQMVKKIWSYLYSFWRNSQTWQMDRHTDTAWWHRPRLCIALRGKNHQIFMKFCTQQQILNWMNITWSKMKKLHRTDSEFDRTYFLFIIYRSIWQQSLNEINSLEMACSIS